MTALHGDDQPVITLDLAEFRSRITDLHIQSIELATDLLSMLGPVPLYVPARRTDFDLEVVQLTRTFDDAMPAARQMSLPSGSARAPLELELVSVG